MGIYDALTTGPGYYLGQRLTELELRTMHGMIAAHYLERLRATDPTLEKQAAVLGIENYHRLAHGLDHGAVWPKEARLLPAGCLPVVKKMAFYRAIADEFHDIDIFDAELNWRLVRPHALEDVGPVHADGWFWDLGYGRIPEGYDRFKVWVPLVAEPGSNGLSILPNSHRRDWKHHTEVRHGIPKPAIDENVEELGMQLLFLSPGEMVMFHDRLLHAGVVNRGTRCRVSLELTIFFRKDFAVLRGRRARSA
jgi:hypothetical protein